MNPKWNKVIVIAVVLIAVGAGVLVYYELSQQNCNLKSKNPLVVDQYEAADTADPQWAASTPGWGLVQQVYQTLVMYNGTSLTNFTGILAQNWSKSMDGFHWNFTLRTGVHFSNGDPFNAYAMWYSLYRLIDMGGINLYLLEENFWYPGVSYYSPAAQVAASAANLSAELQEFNTPTNVTTPPSALLSAMEADNQSFRVLSPSEIQVNPGFGYNAIYNATTGNYTGVPYAFLLAELATPGAAAVDPIAINMHGGITPGGPNTWMSTNAAGTGPYVLTSFTGSGYTLTPDPNYWATSLAAQETWNNNIQPAKSTVVVNYQTDSSVTIQDLKSGSVATASFAYLGPSQISQLQGISCLTVQNLGNLNPAFPAASGSWWVFMNQSVFPFNNLSVRAAIVHAINYSQVFNIAFGGYASPWVGPVPPGHPYYNPGNLPPYQYNLTLAKQEIANSPCRNNNPACSVPFSYEYLEDSTDFTSAAYVIQQDLKAININVVPVGVTLKEFYYLQTLPNGQCESATSTDGGPFYIGQDFYASDYISPDDWTQQDFLSTGSANICQSGFNSIASSNYNASLDDLVLSTAGTANPTLLAQNYSLMTEIMYQNYTNAWFAVPYYFSAYNNALSGLYQTPMGSTPVSTMSWNTIGAS
jgi:peptide/nickel transport system substrate-binding protein